MENIVANTDNILNDRIGTVFLKGEYASLKYLYKGRVDEFGLRDKRRVIEVEEVRQIFNADI